MADVILLHLQHVCLSERQTFKGKRSSLAKLNVFNRGFTTFKLKTVMALFLPLHLSKHTQVIHTECSSKSWILLPKQTQEITTRLLLLLQLP